MNLYVVVEGETEKAIYTKWISYVNPELTPVKSIADIDDNNYLVFSGFGYPQYFRIIENAIAEINETPIFNRLVIGVDSEDIGFEEKEKEIIDFIGQFQINVDVRIVVQHFCLETWGLGNRVFVRQNPQSERLLEYMRIHNVRENDPELLPSYQSLNRSRFAEQYLRAAALERNVTYRKNRPTILLNRPYFDQISNRLDETEHIASFENFLSAFI